MKRFISLTLIITIVLSLCACSYTGSNTKITLGVLKGVSTLDPLKASADSEKIVAANCFEGLLRLDSEGNMDLGGATRYSVSNDGLVYTFKLNESACWYIPSDAEKALKKAAYSEKITSCDYAFGIKRFILSGSEDLDNIKGATDLKSESATLAGVETPDDHTLIIRLNKPDTDFLYKLAVLPVYPCSEAIYKALGDKYCADPDNAVCNGAYFIKDSSQSETLLERNPDYSGSVQVSNRYISLYTTGSEETLRSRFSDATYDLYVSPSTMILDGCEPSFRCIDSVWGFSFNMNSDIGKNDTLRHILLSAIYYENIPVPDFGVSVAERIIPDNYLIKDSRYIDFSPENLSYTYDIDSGKKKLEELTTAVGHTTYTVNISVPVSMEENMKNIIAVWERCYGSSFKFELTAFELSETQRISAEGKYDLAILPIEPERSTALSVIESLSGAPCYLDSEDIVKSYDTAPDDKTIATDIQNTEKYIVEEGIFVPLFHGSYDIYSVPELTGVYSANGGELLYLHGGIKPEEK